MKPVLNWEDETILAAVIEHLISDFEIDNQKQRDAMRTDEFKLHYAVYTYESYEGNATVVFEYDGSLFEVHGSHCSCNDLEGQWEPELTSWEAIAMRPDELGIFARQLLEERKEQECQ
jgi:hypothetical protein